LLLWSGPAPGIAVFGAFAVVASPHPPRFAVHTDETDGLPMASSGKKKTTMAKLNREHRLRERRMEKQARKEARKLQAAQEPSADVAPAPGDESVE
jgi:hypothetical protein